MAAQSSENGNTPLGGGITFPPPTAVDPPTLPRTALNPSTLPPTTVKPLTPRHVKTILQAFRDYQQGTFFPESSWVVFELSSAEYEQLLDKLERDEPLSGFVTDKVRYDYDPSSSEFIIRMPSTLHEVLLHAFIEEIKRQLTQLADQNVEARSFIENITLVNGAITFPKDYDDDDQSKPPNRDRDPDAAFQHSEALWPGVIVEVANSQTEKSLVNLAEEYLLRSSGGIRVVIGLKLDYKKSKKAWFSIWRHKISIGDDGEPTDELEEVVNHQLFRDMQGEPVISTCSSLEIPLKDFAEKNLTDGIPDLLIVVDSETLCRLLGKAETWNNARKMTSVSQPPQRKNKWRARTLPEQLTASDEEKFT